MERHNIKRLPVVEGAKLVGIITRANLLHAMASFVHEVAPARAEDTAICEQLLAELATQPWAPAIDVTVRNGVVQLSGEMTDERQRQALGVAAENIPGVKKVENYVTWAEPRLGLGLALLQCPPAGSRRRGQPKSRRTVSSCVRDADGQQLAYIYYESEPGRRSAAKLLSKDEARRIAANIAKLEARSTAYGVLKLFPVCVGEFSSATSSSSSSGRPGRTDNAGKMISPNGQCVFHFALIS